MSLMKRLAASGARVSSGAAKAAATASRGAVGADGFISVTVSLTGLDVVDNMLADLPDNLRKKCVRHATRKVAKIVLAEARRIAPRKTGALADSLRVRSMERSKRTRKGDIGHAVVTGERFFAGDQFYGGFLEFGTEQRFTKKRDNRGRIDHLQWQFLRPALYADREGKRQVFVAEIQAWLKKLVANANKPGILKKAVSKQSRDAARWISGEGEDAT